MAVNKTLEAKALKLANGSVNHKNTICGMKTLTSKYVVRRPSKVVWKLDGVGPVDNRPSTD